MHMRQIPSWQENPVIKKVICFLRLANTKAPFISIAIRKMDCSIFLNSCSQHILEMF